ncbi:hypothetical protein AB0C33_29620 [Nonomuraea sp. NPDC048881]|uniref:hypothetical protein n=1 Tax=Nonomuraea sp. NPDC048881 TaxID=3155030 RepID=UPI0033DE9B0E
MTSTVEMPGSCAISSNASSRSLSEYFMTTVSGPHSDHLRVITNTVSLPAISTDLHVCLGWEPPTAGGTFEQARVVVAAGVLGPARVVIVYHPYYEPFVSWARQALAGGGEQYLRAAGLPLPGEGPVTGMTVEWVTQKGAYGDLTSLLNGADHLGGVGGQVYVAFGDNLYPAVNPLEQLSLALPGVTVLGRAYQAQLASSRVVMATEAGPQGQRGHRAGREASPPRGGETGGPMRSRESAAGGGPCSS